MNMLEVNCGNILRELGELPETFAATDEALQVKELFTGDSGEIGDIGDDDSDARAGNCAMEHKIMPLEAV